MNQPIPLKIEELRAGSVVRIRKYGIDNYIDRTVSQWDGDLIKLNDYGYKAIADCEAIPLTPEVLEACGFQQMLNPSSFTISHGRSVDLGDFFVYLHNPSRIVAGLNRFDVLEIPVNSLHQLQNIYFVLTGMELVYKP